ncbi:MAG: 5'-3' exonuclease [Candidatus Kariarchaeaceae archaeon]|jgi:5'-3' exonuclease
MEKRLFLIDGTYELYRMFYGSPRKLNSKRQEVGACCSLLQNLYNLIKKEDISHVAIAFSTVIESFRNDLLPTYKTSERVEPELFSQFNLAEKVSEALGISCWGMIEYEGDDAIATLVAKFKDNDELSQIVILSSDKDFAQCVEGNKVVLFDRVRNVMYEEWGVYNKWGVGTESIVDLQALVGDKSDGIPGVPRWGHKSASVILSKFKHIENIPNNFEHWGIKVRGAQSLAASLQMHRNEAYLYRYVATLKTDVPMDVSLDELRWNGVNTVKLGQICDELEFPEFISDIKNKEISFLE